MKIKSQKQARLFGAVAGGVKTEAKSLSSKEAKKNLKGVNIKDLPEVAKSQKGKKK